MHKMIMIKVTIDATGALSADTKAGAASIFYCSQFIHSDAP